MWITLFLFVDNSSVYFSAFLQIIFDLSTEYMFLLIKLCITYQPLTEINWFSNRQLLFILKDERIFILGGAYGKKAKQHNTRRIYNP